MRNERSPSTSRSNSQGREEGRRASSFQPSIQLPAALNRDIEFVYELKPIEAEYPVYWSRDIMMQNFRYLPECTWWNCYICSIGLAAIVWAIVDYIIPLLDAVYNVTYAVHVLSLFYKAFTTEEQKVTVWQMCAFMVDLVTFTHYVNPNSNFMMFCYYIRLHRPFQYLYLLIDFNLKGSVWGTTAKYCYIFLVLRISWAFVWLHLDTFEGQIYAGSVKGRTLHELHLLRRHDKESTERPAMFLSALYLVNKMFIPIGPSVPPSNDLERVACLMVMMTGCLVVTGFAVASLSLVISLYMRPEETFRARYRLMMKEMKESRLPLSQRDKVETFYKMYWHKQRAVSATKLLPTFPPTLPAIIYTDIYFEATQKSRILRDLSYEFLSELAKNMETIHYIPGDAIIKRSSMKSSIIYITYGDIELVTPEDDLTAILRMTRGTVLTQCAAATPAGFGRAHLLVRAATFCTAHVLTARSLWRVAVKYGKTSGEAGDILAAFNIHLENVKKHYSLKIREETKHKSSILHFRRCLMALKEAKASNGVPLLSRSDYFLKIAGCYMLRNRAQSSLTDEADAICLRPTFPCILQPASSLQFAWNAFVACLTVAVCFVYPYYLVYKKTVPIEFRFFNYMVTAIYILDLIVHLSTGDNVEEGVPITFAQTSSQQMKSPWFLQDIAATLPIFEFAGDGHFAGINKLIKVVKVFRVLKELEVICVYQSNLLRFLTYTLLLTIACYFIAALQQGIMCFEFGLCLVTNVTHPPYWEQKPLDEETVEQRLIFGLYWAISMIMFTTHMETGTENWFNVLYTMIILEICIVLRIFMEAVYSATIMVTTFLREDYDASISIVKSFLIRNQVDPILRQRFITYLQLCWFTDKAYAMTNKRSIFYDLPSHVYQDIVARQRSKYLLTIPFMKYLDKEDLKDISSKARLFYTSPNEILLNTGDISNEIYVIKRGICEILSPDSLKSVSYLSSKAQFGVLVCLLRMPAYYTIRAVTHVQVFSISRKHLMKTIEIPKIKDALDFIKQQPEYAKLIHRREPFMTYIPPAPKPTTERFQLPRKHEPDVAFLQPFYRLGFLSILRYIFPRFTIRPDSRYIIWYECIRAAFAFSSAIIFPSYTYLRLQMPWLYYIAWLLDMGAYFDILQRMLVGYFNSDGILIYHPASTAAYYMKGAFITDLFGCVPLENLESSCKDLEHADHVSHMQQFLMLNRLIQLYRLPSAMHILDGVIERRDILIVLQAIPLFIVVLNVLTCFMVLYSVHIDEHPDGWVVHTNPDPGGSWLVLFADKVRFNMTESPWNLHLATYFWVVYEATTTGYNVFNPSNFKLMRVLLVGMLTGAMIITFFSVRIISIRANVNKALAEFQEHMKDMLLYMKKEKLDPELQKEVLDYYEYNWDKMGGVDYRQVFKLCDQITLRTDAILHIYGPTFAKCPILSLSDASLLRTIGRAVRSVYFLRDMTIIESSDVISDMYFVDYGGVIVKNVGNLGPTLKLSRGSVFGNLDGQATIRCLETIVASNKLHLLMINSQAFHQIISDFPIVKQLMQKYRTVHNSNFIMGSVGESMKPWRERTSSTPKIVTRKGLIKYLYFKDTAVQVYLLSISLLCVYADVYNAGFQSNKLSLIAMLYALDLGFLLKILLQYTLPIIVNASDSSSARNVLIPMRRAYFRREFWFDLVSCVPIEMLCFLENEINWMLFSWLRLNRVFRIITVYKCLKRYQEQITSNLIFSTMLSVIIWFTLFVHLFSCLWYFIGVMEDRAEPASSWIYKDDGSSWCGNLYLCSIYFVLTTFTQNGVGDIMPKKHAEVIFVCILQIISTMVYMVYVGEFSNIIQYKSFRCFSFYTKYLELQEFLKNNRVSKNLVEMVNKYCHHLWRESRGMQAPHFLQTAPHALRLRIMSAAYLHHLQKHYIFENCEPAFLRQLVGCLIIYTYNEDMFVVKAGEITDAMYLIHSGKVRQINPETGNVTRLYVTGAHFGVEQGLSRDVPYTHSYQTSIKSLVLTLRLDDWILLLKHFPASRDTINMHIGRHGSNTSGSNSSGNSWPYFPQAPPKSRVTELIDKSTQPSPSTRVSSWELNQGTSPAPPFVPPAGPILDSHSTLDKMDESINYWPKDSRHVGSSSSSEQVSIKLDDGPHLQATSQTTVTSDTRDLTGKKSSFLEKVASKARKLIRGSALHDSDTSEYKLRDTLLEQEDELTTTALIKAYNEKKKSSEKYFTEKLDNEIALQTLGSSDNINLKKIEEKEMTSLEISSSSKLSVRGKKPADDVRKEKKETSTADVTIQTDGDSGFRVPEDKGMQPAHSDRHDQSTSTRNKRFVRVRYEEDRVNPDEPSVSTDLHNEKSKKSSIERNILTMDSDIVVNAPKEEEDTSTSTTSYSSNESDNNRSSRKRKHQKRPPARSD